MTTDVADDDEDNADVDEHGRDGAADVDDDMRTECAPAAVVGRLRAGFFLNMFYSFLQMIPYFVHFHDMFSLFYI